MAVLWPGAIPFGVPEWIPNEGAAIQTQPHVMPSGK